MTSKQTVDTHDINALLETERQAVLQGDFPTLERLQAHKAALLARLSNRRMELDQSSGADLQQKALRNQRLLSSAARGIANTQQRLQELRNAQSGAPSYTARGQRTEQPALPSITKQV
ncbi:MAG: hypothetical protein OIF40_14985 [Mangrovicoccus sp.]|nr:hypothetical protein [Mangrovicoccus sp.]